MKTKYKIKFDRVGDGIYTIESYYMDREGFACCYLLEDNGEAAIIETSTNYAVPYILGTLENLSIKREQVKYVILTHIHLDHAGGTGELMRHLPEAQLIVHPRGKKHMIEPEKLIESVKKVYGEEQYIKLYGDILPVPKASVITANDGDTFFLGNRELAFYDTPGHAKHHNIIHDKKTGSIFSGDNFGIGYPRMKWNNGRFIFPSTSPTQFEPDKALETYNKIISLNPSRILLTHFSILEDIAETFTQLSFWINKIKEITAKRYGEGYRNEELVRVLADDLWNLYNEKVMGIRGTALTAEEKEWLKLDVDLNAQGMAYSVDTPSSDPGK